MVGALSATPQDAVSDGAEGSGASDDVGVRDAVAAAASNGSPREPVPTGARVPPAFSAKGLEGPAARQLRYTAPSDDGSVEERSVSESEGSSSNGAPQTRAQAQARQRRSSKKARRRGK
jgi:hypothetical protein